MSGFDDRSFDIGTDFYNKLAVVEQNYNQIRLRHSSTDKKDPDLDSLIQTAKSTLGELLARLSSSEASNPCVTNTRWFLRYRDALCSFYSGYSHNSDDFDSAFCDFKKAAEEADVLLQEINGTTTVALLWRTSLGNDDSAWMPI